MTDSKLLRHMGPLERLFTGSTCAPVLDFFMLAAEEDKTYYASEIARFSGISIKKVKIAIHNLQEMDIMIEVHEKRVIGGRSKKKDQKRYKFNTESNIIFPLGKLVLAVTDIEIKKPAVIPMHDISADGICQNTEEGIGVAASELIEKGLIKLDHQTEQD